jgi:hypothetical protein
MIMPSHLTGRLELNVPLNRLRLRVLKTKTRKLDDGEGVLRQVLLQPRPENFLQLRATRGVENGIFKLWRMPMRVAAA